MKITIKKIKLQKNIKITTKNIKKQRKYENHHKTFIENKNAEHEICNKKS